jgi:hypothetical protein
MSESRVSHAASLHCEEVFKGVTRRPFIFRCLKAAHQAFQYGAIWQRQQDERRIRGLRGRIKRLEKELEESHEYSRKQSDAVHGR